MRSGFCIAPGSPSEGVPRADLVEQGSCVVTEHQVEVRAACAAQRGRVGSLPRHRVWLEKDAMSQSASLQASILP
jgi:hypothetical protein